MPFSSLELMKGPSSKGYDRKYFFDYDMLKYMKRIVIVMAKLGLLCENKVHFLNNKRHIYVTEYRWGGGIMHLQMLQ